MTEVSSPRIASQVRQLHSADLTDVLELSRLAGWNQTEADWHRLLALAPDGCFCIDVNGRVVATTTLVTYRSDCAWIGMVLTHPDWRGHGYARALVAQTLAVARDLGIACIKLDATDQGRSLYESFGFTPEQIVERWERSGTTTAPHNPQNYALSMDELAYGYRRENLLQSLGSAADRTDVGGYLLTRPGAINSYVGPCIARDPATARRLLTPVLDAVPGSGWFWDLLVENHNATSLAHSLGFTPVRRLVRMSLGAPRRGHEQHVYAIAGLEFG